MPESERHGGCRCGAVRFVVTGEPVQVGLCHCTDCRKETGSLYLPYADWPVEAFSVSGTYRIYEGRSFCPECGTALFHLSEHHAEICMGALDDVPLELVPTREGWIKRREPWLAPVPGATQHAEDPPRSG